MTAPRTITGPELAEALRHVIHGRDHIHGSGDHATLNDPEASARAVLAYAEEHRDAAGERLSDAQCDRLRDLTTEWGKAVDAVRAALEYAHRPFPAPGEIIAAAWDGLGMLEGSEEEAASG